MKNKLITGILAIVAVSTFSIVSGPIRSQTTSNRPPAVDEASWVPISNQVGIELIEDGQSFRSNVQQAHLWVAGTNGFWRRVEIVRPARVRPLGSQH